VDRGDIRSDPAIAREILEFIEKHRVLSVAMTDAIIGCPTKKESTTQANGARFANFGMDETALQVRGYINSCGKPIPAPAVGTPPPRQPFSLRTWYKVYRQSLEVRS
jgi:hypothetical protein